MIGLEVTSHAWWVAAAGHNYYDPIVVEPADIAMGAKGVVYGLIGVVIVLILVFRFVKSETDTTDSVEALKRGPGKK